MAQVEITPKPPLEVERTKQIFRFLKAFAERRLPLRRRLAEQLWLVHSLDPNRDLQEGDLRRLLIEHVRDPSARRRELEKAMQKAESPFERDVMTRLVAAGHRVQPQVWVGGYRIDLVVGEGRNQVAIECDGDRYHGLEQIPEDMARQAVLERAGWRFVRIRGAVLPGSGGGDGKLGYRRWQRKARDPRET